MVRDNWLKSLGLDSDGSLFVEIDTGIRLYDLCVDHPVQGVVPIRPEDLMKAENRQLYFRFLTTLNEISSILFGSAYDEGHEFNEGDVVVDAGARIGTFTARASRAVGCAGRVIAIEPEPRSYALLCKNIQANQLNNVTPIQKVLWSAAQPLEFYLSGNAAAHSAYCDGFYGSTGETIVSEAVTLDGILEELGIGRVDFVKMDIEGSEIEALKGMSRILSSGVELSIAAYHPVNGILTHSVLIPQLERLGFNPAFREGIIRCRTSATRVNV